MYMAKLVLTKSQKVKLAVYAILIFCTCLFGILFKINYNRYMNNDNTDVAEINLDKPDGGPVQTASLASPPVNTGTLITYGGLFVCFSIATGLTLGRLLSGYIAEKFVNTLHGNDDTAQYIPHADYEKAEEEWAKNNFLGAIELFREYLKENPTEIHASIRIAEIYEKDLKNYIAAAMEYEEVLKQRLPDEQWGWTAVHLCNLYIGKLNRPDDAIVLMKKIVRDYEFTAAAAKARQHLDRMGEEYEDGNSDEATEDIMLSEATSDNERTSVKKRKYNKNLPASEQFKDLS